MEDSWIQKNITVEFRSENCFEEGTLLFCHCFKHPPTYFGVFIKTVIQLLYPDSCSSPEKVLPNRRKILISLEKFEGVAHVQNETNISYLRLNTGYILSTFQRFSRGNSSPISISFNNLGISNTVTTRILNAQATPVPDLSVPQELEPFRGDAIDKLRFEISGVLIHEIVHIFQYSANETLPWGLIEGIADYVRLCADFAPEHWSKTKPNQDKNWDSGYETTGYFLKWIEETHCKGFVANLNIDSKEQNFDCLIFQKFTKKSVNELWEEYLASYAQ